MKIFQIYLQIILKCTGAPKMPMLPWRQPARTLVAEANLFFICLLNCLIHLHHSLILNKFWSKDFLIQQHESQGEARKYIYHSTCWAMSTAHHWLLVVLEILEFLEILEIETWTVSLIKSCIVRTVWHIHYSMHMGDIRKYYIAILFCKTNTIQKKFKHCHGHNGPKYWVHLGTLS